MQTTLPPRSAPEPGPEPDEPPPTTPPPLAPPSASPAADAPFGASAAAVVAAVMALVLAATAVVFVGRDRTVTGGAAADTGPKVTLTEFAITPATVTVPVGGKLKVTNGGTVGHNLTISNTDLASKDLAPGASDTLDLSGLKAGDYQIICSIPGHADEGMKATLTISADASAATSGSDSSGTSGTSSGGTSGMSGMSGTPGHDMGTSKYSQMSDAMNKTMTAFPAATAGHGNQPLRPKVLAGGIKQFDITAAVRPWEVEPGKKVDAWTYNGTVPGPLMRVNVGDHVRIVLHNKLPMATDLHIHGIDLDNAMDGVAPLTQQLIQPGKSFTYDFVADQPAVAMYHAHHHGQMQMPNGMFGTLLVGEMPLPAGRTVGGHAIPAGLKVAKEMPLTIDDGGVIGYSLNGKSFPATEPITAKRGDWILVHYMNAGGQVHPMHLHEFDQIVVAKDGFPLDSPYVADTVAVAPGERYSVLIHLDRPGTWVWHCHILANVEKDTGMYGMVTAVVVK